MLSHRFPLVLLILLLAALPASRLQAQGTPAWQLRVAYDMDIVVDAPAHQFTGTQQLTLVNESPDTLRHVYYHLYFNAFQPQSLMAERNRHLPDPDGRMVPRILELGPDEIGYHRVETLTQDGTPLSFDVYDTLLRAELAQPIPPGGRTTFQMSFASQVPLQTRRSGRDSREGIDFSMSQWYPKMAYYDSRGWHADPYIGREFYAPFGTFDVTIDIPSEYVLGATGVLQNPDQIGHGYSDRAVEHAPGSRLKWHFVAENVHDFAWAADRDYIHDRIPGDGITYHLLYQPDVAEGWQFLRRFVPAVISYFSDRIGPYIWPQFTVAQAGDGGMEYPMINFITGGRTANSLIGVTAHEAAHEWFYGMLGSNESDYPWMDEGFTSYMTNEAIYAILNPQAEADHTGATRGIMALQERGLFEPLDTGSDWFASNRAYSLAAYSGGEMVLDLLGYVMGDSLRDVFIKEYYRQYLLRHPQPADVERVAEQVSGLELDWFFRQLTQQDVRMDYAVAAVRRAPQGNGTYATDIVLRRNGDMVMPLDVKLTYADGREEWVTIPTSEMMGAKAVPEDWIVAPAWGWTFPTYTLRLTTPGEVKRVEIDPLGRTPDHDRLNNASKTPREVRFLQPPTASLDHYSIGWRPLVTYADRFGPGIGVQARGTYWMDQRVRKAMLTVYPQAFNTDKLSSGRELSTAPAASQRSWVDAFDYALAYGTGLDAVSPHTRVNAVAEKHVGVMQNRIAVSHTLGRWAALGQDRGRVTVFGVHTLQPTQRGFFYGPGNAFAGAHSAAAGVRYEAGRGGDRLSAEVQVGGSFRRTPSTAFGVPGAPIPLERTSATRFTVRAQKTLPAGPFALRARTLLGFGSDALSGFLHYRAGAASLVNVWQNAATRQLHAVESDLYADVPLRSFSGFGPVGYLDGPPTGSTQAWMGTVEVALPAGAQGLLAPLEALLYSGAAIQGGGRVGTLHTTPLRFENLVADAGVGLTYDVSALRSLRRWTAQSDVLQNLRLAARFPLWVSDPDRLGPDEDALAFRYFLGIEVGW